MLSRLAVTCRSSGLNSRSVARITATGTLLRPTTAESISTTRSSYSTSSGSLTDCRGCTGGVGVGVGVVQRWWHQQCGNRRLLLLPVPVCDVITLRHHSVDTNQSAVGEPTGAQGETSTQHQQQQLQQPLQRSLLLAYTCRVCGTRSEKSISRRGYYHGVVLVRCDGCANLHLIADRLGWFQDRPVDVEQLLLAKGELVQRAAQQLSSPPPPVATVTSCAGDSHSHCQQLSPPPPADYTATGASSSQSLQSHQQQTPPPPLPSSSTPIPTTAAASATTADSDTNTS